MIDFLLGFLVGGIAINRAPWLYGTIQRVLIRARDAARDRLPK